MASNLSNHDAQRGLKSLRWPVRLTWLGIFAERAALALWPLMTVVLVVLAVLMLGLHEWANVETLWAGGVLAAISAIGALGFALYHFRIPNKQQALERLDATLKGRPIQALNDTQVIGSQDAASMAVWQAHQVRMAERLKSAKAVSAHVRLARHDPYALRYVAMIFFSIALLFGSIWRVGTVTQGDAQANALATGPVWEGWIDPPRYTGRPTLYLNDQAAGNLSVPEGSLITLRLYGEVGALSVDETVSGRVLAAADTETTQDFTILQDGEIAINGVNGRTWNVAVIPDVPPIVSILDDPESDALGVMTLPFSAGDDYGVEGGEARINLNLAAVTRAHGLIVAPEPRPELTVALPMPVVGDRSGFEENLVEDFSEHPWANLPVEVRLSVLDSAEQQSFSEPRTFVLPGRRFFDPIAAAIIEQRRDLLWSRTNAKRIGQILRAISHRPEDAFRQEVTQLRLRKLIKQLELLARLDRLPAETQDEIAADLWALAVELEEGDLADALERMRQAQERLNQAMRDGASDAEIAELMQELRRATEDYLNQLQRQQAQDGAPQPQGDPQNSTQMSQDDLQRMMDRIQELMEEGRMAEAAEALKELQEMMENMRVTQGGEGQQGQSAGEQAMEGLSDTLREQQGLNDQAFRDLQEQFNPNAQAGENEGNTGRNGGQGAGESHEGQGGEGQGNEGNSEGEQQGDGQSQAESGDQGDQQGQGQGSLADRQQALRDELSRQQGSLPGAGTPEGDAAREALDRAGRAMDNAEDALRRDDLAEAIDSQSQAMEALRDGLQSLGEALAEQQGEQQPGQGQQQANRQAQSTDPLGRDQNGTGVDPNAEGNVSDADVYRRARDLLAEIRRRSSEGERPEAELDYLKRLLERF
jgi:uncharacterized protein (TIGR02302 family)